MIKGKHINIRPVSQEDIPIVSQWLNDSHHFTDYNTFALKPTNSYEKQFTENGFIEDDKGFLVIVTQENELAGSLSYHKRAYGPNSPSRVYNVGFTVAPEFRGKHYGSEALKLLTAYLFETYPIMRVEADTDVTNIPAQKVLETNGFTREGIMRKAQWRKGDWHDLVQYSILRGELP